MIRHIVFFSAPQSHVETVRQGLLLLAEIPAIRTFEIGINAKTDHFENNVDLVVYAEFDDTAALDAYREHPLYQLAIDRVRPLRDIRIAADFDTDHALRRALS